MPFYNHTCTNCDYKEEKLLSISNRDSLVGSACPQCSGTLLRPPEAPGFTDSPSLGRQKAPQDFRNLLSAMKKQNPRSTINER